MHIPRAGHCCNSLGVKKNMLEQGLACSARGWNFRVAYLHSGSKFSPQHRDHQRCVPSCSHRCSRIRHGPPFFMVKESQEDPTPSFLQSEWCHRPLVPFNNSRGVLCVMTLYMCILQVSLVGHRWRCFLFRAFTGAIFVSKGTPRSRCVKRTCPQRRGGFHLA